VWVCLGVVVWVYVGYEVRFRCRCRRSRRSRCRCGGDDGYGEDDDVVDGGEGGEDGYSEDGDEDEDCGVSETPTDEGRSARRTA